MCYAAWTYLLTLSNTVWDELWFNGYTAWNQLWFNGYSLDTALIQLVLWPRVNFDSMCFAAWSQLWSNELYSLKSAMTAWNQLLINLLYSFDSLGYTAWNQPCFSVLLCSIVTALIQWVIQPGISFDSMCYNTAWNQLWFNVLYTAWNQLWFNQLYSLESALIQWVIVWN